ncbi:fimbrillin family protein [Hoylesella shahii]|uniref:Fimbrillin-like protein n=1 Tax=Hoylesella shahii DSM 15611 = JCM 12083 TaxID=1122991 RepID=A0A318HQC3_9BACT|nr:fimbrillin family protein [Hoylesella shahii]PXX17759.1 hypothetical protein EJ73_02646 [Hoylesella shahii DSM 15611 = JCM 12083]
MNTKKTSFGALSLLFMLTVALFSGCVNNTIPATEDNETVSNTGDGGNVTFDFVTSSEHANYIAGNPTSENATRAANTNNQGNVIASGAEDLGNGLEALVEVVETPQTKATTRAIIKAPAGKYTVLAYQNGEQKAKWVLNYNGSSYQATEGTKAEQFLAKGEYTFYVFSEQLTLENGKIVARNGSDKQKALYFSGTSTINEAKGKSKVQFVLKPFFAQVFFKIKAFSGAAFNGAMTGSFTFGANAIPTTCTIDPTTGAKTVENNTAAGELAFGNFTGNQTEGTPVKSYIQSQTAQYMLPGTDVTNMKFKFNNRSSGTIYNKAIKDKTLTITNKIDGNLKEGQSYIVAVTVYYTATYLFSDGTTGTMGKKGTRTPIALVVGKPAGHPYTYAIALKDASGGNCWSTNNGDNTNKVFGARGIKTAIREYNGWDNTYTAAYTRGNIVKATSSNFPAFKDAAEYNPGPNVTGKLAGAKWFLGGLGEWELALQTFGVSTLDGSGDKTFLNYTDPLGYKRITILFEQAEGNPLVGYFWTADCSGLAHTIVIDPTKVKKEVAVKNANRRNDGLTRAFIRFK